MLWADKYRPKDFDNLDYHQSQAADLKNLTKDGDFPHLLVYGPMGAGKKTRIMCILKELYGPGVERLKVDTMHLTTPSNKKLEIATVSSIYHIEINPSDVGIYDKVVIMGVLKTMAQTQQLNAAAQREFKVIVLTDVDYLTKDAQQALRRTMEKYVRNCRMILCTTSISRVIPAIRSRCLCVRVAAPTFDEVQTIVSSVCSKEGAKIPDELAKKIAVMSKRNLRRALLMAEACKVEQFPFTPNQDVKEPDWQTFIRSIAVKIIGEQSLKKLSEVREDLYEVVTFGIPSEIIFTTLLEEILKHCDMELTGKIVEQAAIYEHRIVALGNKEIFHLEAFVAKCMCLYQGMMQELLEGF